MEPNRQEEDDSIWGLTPEEWKKYWDDMDVVDGIQLPLWDDEEWNDLLRLEMDCE